LSADAATLAPRPPAPQQRLYFLPLPQGQGAFLAGSGLMECGRQVSEVRKDTRVTAVDNGKTAVGARYRPGAGHSDRRDIIPQV